jgi:hypothetical protein
MRGLNLIDVIVIAAVVALLIYAGTQDFGHYEGRTLPVATPAAAAQG